MNLTKDILQSVIVPPSPKHEDEIFQICVLLQHWLARHGLPPSAGLTVTLPERGQADYANRAVKAELTNGLPLYPLGVRNSHTTKILDIDFQVISKGSRP